MLKHDGEKIGHDGGVCTVTSIKGQETQCPVTFPLSGDQIVIAGLNKGTEEFLFAVTGGTGRYQGVSCEAHIVIKSETVARVTIDPVA